MFSDDAGLAAAHGADIRYFSGEPGNIKLTTPEDFGLADRRCAVAVPSFLRVATGMDIHAFGPGDRVFLGGVEIPCDRGLTGHSDADVVLHAATDALLGALGLGDIGTHFPPSDPRWKGARSRVFLAFAMEKLRERGGVLDFLDIVLLCEKPRIAPFREAMRDMIAQIAGIARDEVAVKATTTEGLGFTGRGEGIFAQATATIRLPDGKIGS
jgi:2-C-methyl-D-erythritol 4-phosphate cytidylyltransferase/2-C-methyl-D-erythritol 2,4-cyclodiphosphate synthase